MTRAKGIFFCSSVDGTVKTFCKHKQEDGNFFHCSFCFTCRSYNASDKLTTSMLHFRGGLLSTSRDCRKVNMEAGECSQQLTISLTCTPLVHAAARRLESMAGQNLDDKDRIAAKN